MIEMSKLEIAQEHADRRRFNCQEQLAMRREVATLDLQIKQREAGIKAAIAAELTEDGKPLYSNDVKRDAELICRAANDEVLTALKAEREQKDFDAAMMGFDAQYHADMKSIHCAFAEVR